MARLSETVDHLASVIEALDTPPFIIGHSFGGTLTQLLLARGLGSVGVVIDSALTEGVHVTPLSDRAAALEAPRAARVDPADGRQRWHARSTGTRSSG